MAGDEAVLAPGVYEEGAVVTTPNLVLRGEPGAHLRGHAVEGKAALVIKAAGVVIEGIECSGIAVRDNNGACIRIEGDDLTVRNVHFHDNQQGILSGPGGGVLLVEGSLLERNGFGGQAHGVYIGPTIETFIFRNNRVLATTGAGHGVKSRAQSTILENNVIAGLDGNDSRAIDLPNGGDVVIRGNVLEKGPNSANAQMIGLALEGDLHEVNQTLIEGNLVIFDTLPVGLVQNLAQVLGLMPPKGTVLVSESPGPVILRNNTIVGARDIGSGVPEQDNRMYRSRAMPACPLSGASRSGSVVALQRIGPPGELIALQVRRRLDRRQSLVTHERHERRSVTACAGAAAKLACASRCFAVANRRSSQKAADARCTPSQTVSRQSDAKLAFNRFSPAMKS